MKNKEVRLFLHFPHKKKLNILVLRKIFGVKSVQGDLCVKIKEKSGEFFFEKCLKAQKVTENCWKS